VEFERSADRALARERTLRQEGPSGAAKHVLGDVRAGVAAVVSERTLRSRSPLLTPPAFPHGAPQAVLAEKSLQETSLLNLL
jgi:hypothetical protein